MTVRDDGREPGFYWVRLKGSDNWEIVEFPEFMTSCGFLRLGLEGSCYEELDHIEGPLKPPGA